MPFFVGRIATHRLASSVAATSSSRLVVAKQLGRVSCSPLLRAGFVRAYATPGRPKKSDTGSSIQSADKSRKPAVGAAPKKAAAAAKKTTATKTTTKTPAKKATRAAKSPKAKKASPPPKKKKVLTDKQKAAKEHAKVIKEKAELKQKALYTEPKTQPSTAWQLFVTRESRSGESESVTKQMPKIANDFRALSSSELEELRRTADANKLQNAANYKAWVESHPPEQIAAAQHARSVLKRKFDFPKRNVSSKIRDDRQPKHPGNAYTYYYRARFGSGDFAGEKITEVLKAVAVEWKSLPAVERQPFEDLAAADLTRYKKQVAEVLHR